MTFAINSRLLGEGLVVTDAEAADAVRFAFEVLKLVLEPGGAVALAAVLAGKIDTQGRPSASSPRAAIAIRGSMRGS